jgi:intergrase/recombinase
LLLCPNQLDDDRMCNGNDVYGMDKSFLDWKQFAQWVNAKYAKTYARIILQHTKKYYHLLNDVKSLDLIKPTIKNNVIKSLIILSKFLGIHEQFKYTLKNYGVKLHKQDALQSFLRILKASDSDILDWYEKAITVLRPNEQLYLKFCKAIGARKEECISAFNLIIELARQGNLSQYYNQDLCCLMHFKYGKLFLRTTKNVYISFIPESIVNEIANSQPLTYPMIRKKLDRSNLKVRINELRDYYATCMRSNNILREEIDMLQGRIPTEIFVRHYWSPKLVELRDRIFNAIKSEIITTSRCL